MQANRLDCKSASLLPLTDHAPIEDKVPDRPPDVTDIFRIEAVSQVNIESFYACADCALPALFHMSV